MQIQIEELSKKFGRKKVLGEINLKISNGDFLMIFGPNGSGKTTLLKVISGLIKQTSGTIKINGKEDENIKKYIGMISHETYLYENLTAEENLRFYGKMYSAINLEEKIEELLKNVNLQNRKKDEVKTFSRGMKQRLAVARALINSPEILLLDEPFTGLDVKATKVLIENLKNFKDKIVIMTSHSEEHLQLCSRYIIIVNGKIKYESKEVEIEEFKKIYNELIYRFA